MGASASLVTESPKPGAKIDNAAQQQQPSSSSGPTDDEMLQNIRLIEFEDFLELGTFPRFPQCHNIVKTLNTLSIELYNKSLIIFISHCWLRGWSGAEGWDGRPHPDNANGDKFKLCVDGIQFIKQNMAPGMEKCYIWLDFGCIDQDGNPAGELKMLDKIVEISDCIFTPIYDPDPTSWKLPPFINNMYKEYNSPAWIGTPHSYLNRGWCRVEMFYAANIPLFNPYATNKPLLISNEVATHTNNEPRHSKFSRGFAFQIQNGRRPHILYGTNEKYHALHPFIMPPLLNSWFDEYHPENGNLSVPTDKDIIHQLVEDIKPYMKQLQVGYYGELNDKHQKHGRGKQIYASGDIYEGMHVNDIREGYGKYLYCDGDCYEGEYKNNKRHGKGRFTYGNGTYYDGDWVDGVKQGFGFYDFGGGMTYEGEWLADNFHGKGKKVFHDGSVYEGDFVEDLPHGFGRKVEIDGTVYEGKWEEGNFIEG